MKRVIFNIFLMLSLIIELSPLVSAYDDDELTPAEKITIMVQHVNDACALIKKEGKEKAYKILSDLEGPFIFLDTYIWVININGIMDMHPIKPELVGRDVRQFRDIKGKYYILEIKNKILREGHGWVEYDWPKKGESKASKKVAFVKLVKLQEEKLAVCTGLFDITLDDVTKYETSKK